MAASKREPLMKDPISRMTLRSSLVHWRYSAATVLIVGIGMLAIWVFRGYMLRVGEMYRDHFTVRSMFGEILIETTAAASGGEDLKTGLSLAQQQALAPFLTQEAPKIKAAIRFLNLEGQVNLGSASSIFSGLAYDVPAGETVRGPKWAWNAVAGRPLRSQGEVVLGRTLATLLGCTYDGSDYLQRLGDGPAYAPGDRPFQCASGQQVPKLMLNTTTESGQLNAKYLTVVGLMDVGFRDLDRTWLMLSLEDGQALLHTDKISWLSLSLVQSSLAKELAAGLNAFAAEHALPVVATTWDEHRFTDLYRRTMDLLGFFETFVMSILVGIVGIAVFNLMVKIVQERRREIGLLRAVGYLPQHILRLFLGEALLTSLAGILCGTLGACAFTFVANHLGILYKAGVFSESVPFVIGLNARIWLGTASLLVAIAMVASSLAIQRALRQEVSDCLAA